MAFVIVSDKPLGERERFIQEMMEAMDAANVQKIAVIGALSDGGMLSCYWNMSLKDKLLTSSWINMDVVNQVIRANMPYEEDEEDGDADL